MKEPINLKLSCKPWKTYVVTSLQFCGTSRLCSFRPDRTGLNREIGYFTPLGAGQDEEIAIWQHEIGKEYMVKVWEDSLDK